jgi:hypothetical protein
MGERQLCSETLDVLANQLYWYYFGTYLGIMSVHSVDFDVLFRNISFEIEDKW